MLSSLAPLPPGARDKSDENERNGELRLALVQVALQGFALQSPKANPHSEASHV